MTNLNFFSWNTYSGISRGRGSWLFGSGPHGTRDSSHFVSAVSAPFYPCLFLTRQMYLSISQSCFGLKYYFFWQSSSNILYFWPIVLRVPRKFRTAHTWPTSWDALCNCQVNAFRRVTFFKACYESIITSWNMHRDTFDQVIHVWDDHTCLLNEVY